MIVHVHVVKLLSVDHLQAVGEVVENLFQAISIHQNKGELETKIIDWLKKIAQ